MPSPPVSTNTLSGYIAGSLLLAVKSTIRVPYVYVIAFLSTIQHDKGAGVLFLNSRECGFEIIGAANFQGLKCDPQSPRRDLHLSQQSCVGSVSRIPKDCHTGGLYAFFSGFATSTVVIDISLTFKASAIALAGCEMKVS